MNIKEKYKPYNFSETRCFIITVTIPEQGVKKIESKLPADMKRITGIYVTSMINNHATKVLGTLSLGFDEGIKKSVMLPIRNTLTMSFHSQPLPLNEEIKTNSTVQGYFQSIFSGAGYPYQIKIYLHYKQQL